MSAPGNSADFDQAYNDLVRSTTERIGANIMGKRMFDQGERAWPEEAPFHTPVYVLTNEKREPWARLGGTTFYFINDGPERALGLARESAGSRDIRIAGGADVIQQFLNLGVVDELKSPWHPCCSAVGGVSSKTYANLGRSFALIAFLMVQLPHTCAMCVSESVVLGSTGIVRGSSMKLAHCLAIFVAVGCVGCARVKEPQHASGVRTEATSSAFPIAMPVSGVVAAGPSGVRVPSRPPEMQPSEHSGSDPTLLPYHAVLLYEWPVWKSPTEFQGDLWLVSGLHNVIEKSEPLARYHDGNWMLYSQPLHYPYQLAADDVGMLVAGDDQVAVRRAGEPWNMTAAPVNMPAKRDGVPGVVYSSGNTITAAYGSRAWRWSWTGTTWEVFKPVSSNGRGSDSFGSKSHTGSEFDGHSGRIYWFSCGARSLNEPLEEMRRQPRYTLFVRQPGQLYRARGDGSLEAIPYLPFVEWMREDEYIAEPTGLLQIGTDGTLFQLVEGLKDDRAAIVRLLPKAGVYKPVGSLPRPVDSFWLRGIPYWRTGREIFSLDGKSKITELPKEFDQAAKDAKARGNYVPLLFSRTETVLVLDTGIFRHEGKSWVYYPWAQLGIQIIEVSNASAAFSFNDPKVRVPEFIPTQAVDNLLLLRSQHGMPIEGDEEYVLDLNQLTKGVFKQRMAHSLAPRSLMPETAGSISKSWRKILFYNRDAVYETDDTWDGYWQGFVGFTPYFRARGHVFRADVN